jgi:DNA sulfur modification protein DndD
MKFKKLLLENFASYYGKHSIEFHTESEKPVTIIVGGGGKGKTSIFDAINWALYGAQYEPEMKRELEKKITDYINVTALKVADTINASVEMACTLFFDHENKNYRIQQAICAKSNNHVVEITDRTSILYEISPNGNGTEITYIDSFLNEILPSNVRDYFLFNGDRIKHLAMPGSSEEIRDGIYRVVDLELLQKGAEHLREAAKKFRKQAKDLSVGEVKEIEDAYSTAYEDLDKLKKSLNTANEEKRALEDKIEVVESKLRGMDEVKDLQKRREILQEKLKYIQDLLKQTTANLRSISSIAILRFVLPDFEILMNELNTKRSRGEIPSSISESLLMDILEIKKCICGTDFKEGDRLYSELERRLNYEKNKEKNGQLLLDLFFELKQAKFDIEKNFQRLPEFENTRSKQERQINEIDKELSDIMVKLKDAPEEEISKLASNLSEFLENLSNNKLLLLTLQKKIEEKDDQIKKLLSKREELGVRHNQVKRFQLRDNLAQKAADELQMIFEKFAEDSRREVEVYTRQEFQKFIPTGSALKVGIDQEFHYDVRDENNNPALQQLSMGQKQSLSLAYITSISRVSEKNPPLVIDMPFGRLDKDVQENIAMRLPDLASQVILLVLPETEWNNHTESILRSKTSDIYYLEFDENLRQTQIRRG